jgi:hypothetical protein
VSSGRRFALSALALVIDLIVLFVVVPTLLVVPVVGGFAALFYARTSDCPDPCDGPAMAATGVWFLVILVFAIGYWPLLRWRGRRTVGQWAVARLR